MKIKVAVLEHDEVYLDRLISVFNVKYADKLEIYSFTDRAVALRALKEKKIDVFLADERFTVEEAELPPGCGFAYLVEAADIEEIKNTAAVCKFQKAEMLYRRILGLFSEKAAAITGVHMDAQGGRTLAFVSAGGGAGSSTAAAACAMRFSQKGKRVLYLNLESFGSADVFFHGDGNSGLGDVIYAVKSRKGNLAMKLESAVKRDESGVFFYSPTKMALDIEELSCEEARQVIGVLRLSGAYEVIILDLDLSMDKDFLALLEECHTVVFVADGSRVSNGKLERAIDSLRVIEQQSDRKILMRSGLLYNRFSSQTSQKPMVEGLKEFGGIGRYEGFDTQQLLRQLREQPVFDALEREIEEE